ncbi:MAG: hypothetical protein IT287_09840 [Bdellovibrionaceae bacterium]|nr:hypothetical protein [Pseudobdellovibrionaceae bacterium]
MASAFWPYEEVQFSIVNQNKGQFLLKTPWSATPVKVTPDSIESAAILNWIQYQDNMDQSHWPGLWNILDGLQPLPVAYELPRHENSFGSDAHKIKKKFHSKTPQSLAKDLQLQHHNKFSSEWTWDFESILQFSDCGNDTIDPLSVLTVARRFHHLSDEQNKMSLIYDYIQTTAGEKNKKDVATIIRQNHFATEKCATLLQPATDIAQSQKVLVEKWIREEKSCNAILGSGLKAMNIKHSDLPLTEGVQNLMQLLEKCAFYNFLAFSISLDIFENPQFKDQSPLSEVLLKWGETTAARALQAHTNMNDTAENGRSYRELLLKMKPVDGPYLAQALQFAELVSKSIIHISHDLEKLIIK